MFLALIKHENLDHALHARRIIALISNRRSIFRNFTVIVTRIRASRKRRQIRQRGSPGLNNHLREKRPREIAAFAVFRDPFHLSFGLTARFTHR